MLVPVLLAAQLPFAGVFVRTEKRISETELENKSSYVKAHVNNVPAHVMNSFLTRYPAAENVSWFVNNKEISAYFKTDGQDINVNFKKNGLLLSTRKTYDALLLDQRVREFLFHEMEPCYTFKYVTEVVHENEIVYEVSMETERDLCIVRVIDRKGQALVIEDQTKLKKG